MSRKCKLLGCATLALLIAGLSVGWLTRPSPPAASPFCQGAVQAGLGKAAPTTNCAACHQQDRLQELVAKVRSLWTKTPPAATCPGAAQPAQIGSKACAACHAGQASN